MVSKTIGLVILICFLILTFFFGFVYAAIYTARNNQCQIDPNPWCYMDWQCLDSDGKQYNVSDRLRNYLVACSPIATAAGIPKDPETGEPKINPSTGKPYVIGDINWEICRGASWYKPPR